MNGTFIPYSLHFQKSFTLKMFLKFNARNCRFVVFLMIITLVYTLLFAATQDSIFVDNLSDTSLYVSTLATMSSERETPEPVLANDIIYQKGANVKGEKRFSNGLTTIYVDYAIRESKAIRRLPKAIIIGVKKCGTRALLEYLKLHPEVRAPGPEPHFFDRYFHLGPDWYRQKMPPSFPGQITIEKTPRYFVTKEAPERIYNLSKHMKLLLVTRDPVVRAISDFTQAVSKHMYSVNVTFKMKALRHNGDVNTRWSAITTGMYSNYLPQWLNYFDLSNIHFVSGENLIANPMEELNSAQDFLGLERKIDNTLIYYNHTRGFPCIRRTNKSPKCFRRSKGRRHMKTDIETLRILYEFYSPHNEYYYQLSGKNFTWENPEKET